MIPKTIHYIWFGNKPLSPLTQKCIRSWQKYLPDYEIKLWNENNFDISMNRFCKEAYEQKKYAFVSDYVRIYLLYYYGGIYMDTDVEVVKPFPDEFINCEAFSGFESTKTIPTGIMASKAYHPFFKELLAYYDNISFVLNDGQLNTTTNVKIITDICLNHGFLPNGKKQVISGFTLYPQTYFCPLSHDSAETLFSDNTYTIHHFNGSWCDRKTQFVGNWYRKYQPKYKKIYGENIALIIYKCLYNYFRILDNINPK
ncbi:hypothetical protein SDC9_117000 [bioreactor metagenome]|uniref:Subversion of eukaryotic traffic protein A n=1 Tax=bioreactor metagenome TaxID=1076179 RepID=A0A645BXD1_9ZZZZ|nr:glycosyltransferase [Oscillospiraceae bacterium]